MNEITVGIDGMACSMCESHVNEAIRNAFKVDKVTSSHKKGICTIIAEDELTEEALKKVLDPTGYRVTSVDVKPYEKKGFRLFKK